MREIKGRSTPQGRTVGNLPSRGASKMGGFSGSAVLLALGGVLLLSGQAHGELTPDYYASTCPQVQAIVQCEILTALKSDARIAASLLRLHFHDCFVLGCDASVLLDSTSEFATEKTSKANNGSLRGFDVVDTIKAAVEESCPNTVSCADLLAIISLQAAIVSGGQGYGVLLGRKDGFNASATGANENIPTPFLNVSGLVEKFAAVNLSEHDMVTLSGSHTIGRSRCKNIVSRLYPSVENGLNATYAESLEDVCPNNGNESVVTDLDPVTPNQFDNQYYKNLRNGIGALHTDTVLWTTKSSQHLVKHYSKNLTYFWTEFGRSMIKMGNAGVLEGSEGEVRRNCRVVNSNNPSVLATTASDEIMADSQESLLESE